MQRAQDMIVGAGIVGGMIGAVVGGVLWIINPEVDGNAATLFGLIAAAIMFTVLYLGWARPPLPGPTGPRDLSPAPEDLPGAGTRAQRMAIGADAQPSAAARVSAPLPSVPPAPTAPPLQVKSSQLSGETELSARKGEWTYDAGKPETTGEQTRPAGLDTARDGAPDDLKQIKGVGPKLEAMLHGMGFFHFDQVASWTEAEIAWVDENLEGFKGRVTRDDWVAQAKVLSQG